MTVIGALSSFRELGELSPHNALIVSDSRIVGTPEVGRKSALDGAGLNLNPFRSRYLHL